MPTRTIDSTVRERARNRPDDIAVIGLHQPLTWRQLDEAADRAARVLAENGVGPGSLVGWFGANDVGYPVVLLATWRRRAGLVGVNWRLPDHDQRSLAQEISLTHLVSGADLTDRAERIAEGLCGLTVVDQSAPLWPDIEPEPETVLEPEPGDTAMVFFTSGSTGTPKSVPLTRRANELTVANPNGHGIHAGTRQLIVPPVFHLAGAMWAQYGLLYGTTQVYIADASPKGIVDALNRYEITHAVFVPTLIRAVVDQLRAEPVALPSFRHLAYGAAPITQSLIREALEFLDCEFCQVFGMTEIGGTASFLRNEEHLNEGKPARLTSAGRPAPTVQLQVRDLATGEVLPTGASGGLWVRSPFMAQGYIGRERETRAVFVDGWLNTRDVGHLDEDGFVYVEGRSDDMIVSGGENVHPGEIENAIAQLPQVAECAVYGVLDERWGRKVCAAVVPRGPDLTEEAVIEHCRTVLAGYKVPKLVRMVPELPRTANGKLIRKRLIAETAEEAAG
ncbi:acyl-CoA synthetase (AMP-forming)/AMP-acid ligase II [Spinactinospora alkalitolerans]|uniref:Acyl-CoA synthetase (AMP-forming)/AMP-acid ligase II n=1 Tax=Spinactinospora alkalitolerans TaxID=687207 RepID=A0A852TUX8_9ACTN|nr:AMP-binding protein [Spinactinospora alkalitolerans]NYE47839.1 acyl-CoA synthetase (AMP-forming)/AMP-acid ligase II [Spinactinospora alkalitolerans]